MVMPTLFLWINNDKKDWMTYNKLRKFNLKR